MVGLIYWQVIVCTVIGLSLVSRSTSLGTPPIASQRIVIDTSRALHVTTPHFLSVAIDSDQIRWHLRGFNFTSKKLQHIAEALSPANIRWGGTYADFLHFDPDASDEALPSHWTPEKHEMEHAFDHGFSNFNKTDANFTMSGKLWDQMTEFCHRVGWDIMFDFNLFFWKNGYWNPANADLLLSYSSARGVSIPSFQLGNEPNAYDRNFNFTIASNILARDFMILRHVISKYSQYDASGLYGPDVTNLANHGSSRDYLSGFLKSGGCDAVTEVSLHHYYKGATVATLKDFLNPDLLDTLKDELDIAYNITMQACGFHKPLRLTETSSCYGGGAPKISDAYVAGFMWMDKLGLSAKYGLSTVFRQTFFEASYALIDMKLNPNPDYYLSLLFKRLVVGPVFHVITSGSDNKLRVYAQCVRKGYYDYPDGALVLYLMNLDDQDVTISLAEYQNAMLDVFMLTPGDSTGMLSRFVKLNGQTLLMNGDKLPELAPKRVSGDVTLKAQSFGFIVIASANVHLCNIYHTGGTN